MGIKKGTRRRDRIKDEVDLRALEYAGTLAKAQDTPYWAKSVDATNVWNALPREHLRGTEHAEGSGQTPSIGCHRGGPKDGTDWYGELGKG